MHILKKKLHTLSRMHWNECGTGSLRIKDAHETHSYHVWSAVEMRVDAVVGVQKGLKPISIQENKHGIGPDRNKIKLDQFSVPG